MGSEDDATITAKGKTEKKKGEGGGGEEVVLQFSEPQAWVERMTLTGTRSLPSDLAPDDDPKREEVFIQHALLSVLRGLTLLEQARVPWQRPADYFAEMYKDDVHMNKIRESIQRSRVAVESRAQRRAMKDQKKFGKEVQAEVLRQRAKHKRDLSDRLHDWNKKRKGAREDLDEVIDKDDDEGDERPRKRARGEQQRGGGRGGGGPARPKNLRPGGARKGPAKRPGKNARRRK
jgi:rRNA-processing protein EBP2